MDIFIKDGTELDAVEYQFQFFFPQYHCCLAAQSVFGAVVSASTLVATH